MISPLKYKNYDGKLWIKSGEEEVWKVAKVYNNSPKIITPISQNYGEDFVWRSETPVGWKGRYLYRDILKLPKGHNGIDFTAPIASCVYAPFDGKITRLDKTDAWGMWLTGEKLEFVGLHLSKFIASLNQEVKKGDLIALTGNTGMATTAPHLHGGVRLKNWQEDGMRGYFDFRDLIENLDVEELPYKDGDCLLVRPWGKFYVVENGDLVYYDSEKDPITRHIDIVDFFIKKNKTGLPPNFIKVTNENDIKKFNNLIIDL